jgi:iron-chelate-transporting ATPase
MSPGSTTATAINEGAAAGQTTAPAFFELTGIGFDLAGRRIIDDLTIKLDVPHVYALVGPNGSGKSSLLKLLANQNAPSRGRLFYRGRDMATFGRREFARAVAYLPQFPPPADSMTVRELVALGRFPWHGPLGRFTEDDAQQTASALRRTGLLPFSDRLVDELSGGERHRAWLAMMLAQGTDCLLLDEPTAALDIAHQVEILALIRDISRERSVGVVVVLHDINMAARFCDEILALKDGEIIARGKAGEVLTAPLLETLYGIGMEDVAHPSTGLPMCYVR